MLAGNYLIDQVEKKEISETDPDMTLEEFLIEVFTSFNHLCQQGFKCKIRITNEGMVDISVFPKEQKPIHIFAEWSTHSQLEIKAFEAKVNHIIKTIRAK